MSNAYLVDTRVYIAGVLMPAQSITIENYINDVPRATIMVPASSDLMYVGENDKVPVTIFQRESMVGSSRFILMFEGFIVARTYMNTAIQRTITFQAVGIMDILRDFRLLYAHTLSDMARQTHAGNQEKGALSSASYFAVEYFLLNGLNPAGESIRFPYQFLQNVLHFMGDPGINEGSVSSEHTSNMSLYYRKMFKIYNLAKRYLRVPLYDENSSGSTVWSGYRENGFPLLRGLQNSTAVSLLSPFIAAQTTDSQTAWDLLSLVADPMDFEISLPTSPAYIDGNIGSVILKPNLFDSIPPRCNILYRSQVREISQQTIYKGTPTRVQVHDLNSPANWLKQQAPTVQSYFEMLLTIFYPQRKVPSGLLDNATANPYATALLDSEMYTGPWVHEVSTPKWWLWTKELQKNQENINEAGDDRGFVNIRQMLLHRQLVLARYLNRQMIAHTVFNPYVAAGYPGVVYDSEDTSLSFAGYVTGVTHNISPEDVSTQVDLSFVRPLNEASAEQIVHPIIRLQKLLHDKQLMSTVYAGLLGDKAAIPAASVAVQPATGSALNSLPSAQNQAFSQEGSEVVKRARAFAKGSYMLYSQEKRGKVEGSNYYTDCSHFVSLVLGIDPPMDTSTMPTVMPSMGYEWHEGLDGIKEGDVLFKPRGWIDSGGHTEIYVGPGSKGHTVTVGAHTNKNPDGSKRREEDQVSEKAYSNNYVLKHYKGYWRKKSDSQEDTQAKQAEQARAAGETFQNQAEQPQNLTPEEEAKQTEQAQKEIEDKKAGAATQAGADAVDQATNANKENTFSGAEAMTYQEIIDLYSGGTEDTQNPQLSVERAYASQRRNICTFDQFVAFEGLTKELGVVAGQEFVPLYLNGEYMSDRNKVRIYKQTRVQEASENQDSMNKEQSSEKAQDSSSQAQSSEQNQGASTQGNVEQANAAAAAAQAGDGKSPEEKQEQQDSPQKNSAEADDTIGAVSRFLESGGDSSAVGYDPGGGTSYGMYQISSTLTKYGKSSFTAFLDYCEKTGGDTGREIAQRLRKAGGTINGGNTYKNTGDVPTEWKKIAAEGKFGNLEHTFIEQSLYKPTRTILNKQESSVLSYVDRYKTLQDAMWSTANAHGPGNAASLLRQAYAECKSSNDMSEEHFIEVLYARRSGCYSNNSADVQKAMPIRYAEESALLKDALKRERDTGQYKLDPSIVPRMAGHGNKFRNAGGSGSSGSWESMGSFTGGDLNPLRDQVDSNKYTYTKIYSGDSRYKVTESIKDVRSVLRKVSEEAFSKHTYA